ncbi:hypothetical protein HKD37_15G042661 [Glycine soja]
MSISGGAVVAGGNMGRSHLYLGENRVYYPPPLRKYREEQEHEEEQRSTLSENRPGSSSDCSVSSSGTTCDVSNLCRFLEHTTPHVPAQYCRIADLACQFPELKTYRSCDLSPANWVSLAWYPIYRIPTGPTLESMSACFLTFHSLSTALQSLNNDGFHLCSRGRNLSSKLSLLIFKLAFHKLKASVWDLDEVSEGQKADSLLRAADNFQFASSL